MKYTLLLISLVVLASGCINQTSGCDRPYSLIGSQCCLDENADKICDKDKPVCSEPYINVGNVCCLDSNANRICDTDETKKATSTTAMLQQTTTWQPASTVTTTTPLTSTTNAEPAQCSTIDDCSEMENITCDGDDRVVYVYTTPIKCEDGKCIFRSSKGLGAYPCDAHQRCVSGTGCVGTQPSVETTTTIIIRYDYDRIFGRYLERLNQTTTTTTTTTIPCVDSDGGVKLYVKSDNSSGLTSNGTYIQASEYCTKLGRLMEYYCLSNVLTSRIEDCPGKCIDGRCCKTESLSCQSDKECCSGRCATVGMSYHCIG